MMKIVYIHKAVFQKRTPVVSAVTILNRLGYDVTVITKSVSDEWKTRLDKMGVKYHIVDCNQKSRLAKPLEYFKFRKETYAFLKDNDYSPDDTILWIESAYTLVALGEGIKRYRYILQLQELYEHSKRQLGAIRKVINDAEAVFMPEYNRCAIYQVWFKLTKRPYVLPNKLYFVPTDVELKELQEKHADKVALLGDKKVILYEGMVHKERKLDGFVKAVQELGDDYRLALLGTDFGLVEEYKKICPNLVHIPFMPAPDYMAIVAKSYIGIVTYDPLELNTTFCAPNKIFSYGHFGLPMIGNEIPGLKYSVEANGAGILVNEQDSNAIRDAIIQIDSNYREFSQNAQKMYDSVDNEGIIKTVLDRVIYLYR